MATAEAAKAARSMAASAIEAENVDVSRFIRVKKDLEVDKLFRALVKFEGSDLHMKVGRPPMIRVRNELRPLNHPNIERIEMAKLLVPMMNDRNRRIYDDEGGADFSHSCDVDGTRWRFRVNLLQQNGC